ncbi:MAG: amidohydrolase family protein [Acidobacteria bacterium]|nr:amidohydrolase family protein [Acidobacteriota bacterium]MYA46937.1 amidohydrolase family protein [Acidobacteriota bacterium]MYI37861.1 amidohydrolase family protein [Acidobacteriota bacterium]
MRADDTAFAGETEKACGILSSFRRLPMTHRLLLTLALSAGIALPAIAQEPDLALVGGSVLDVREGTMSRANVLVGDGRILSVGAETPPDGVETLDVTGKFVLPGFIDAHTHASELSQVRRALESGATTLRSASVGSYRDVAIGRMVAAGHLAGPDYLGAGVFVTPNLGEARLASESLYGISDDIRSDADLRMLVRVNAENGVRAVKTRATERAGLPDTDPRKQVFSEAQLRAIVEEATALGIPVLCHAHGDEGARAAVLAGVASIEHGTFLTRETLELMAERGTALVPTYTTLVDLDEPGGDYDHPVLTLRADFMVPRMEQTMRMAQELGVRLITGSDTSYGPESVSRVGVEVANFVKVGLSPIEAIRGATLYSAELLGIAEDTGVIEPGKEADLIVVVEDPLENIAAIQDVVAVVSNGRLAVNRLPFEVVE